MTFIMQLCKKTVPVAQYKGFLIPSLQTLSSYPVTLFLKACLSWAVIPEINQRRTGNGLGCIWLTASCRSALETSRNINAVKLMYDVCLLLGPVCRAGTPRWLWSWSRRKLLFLQVNICAAWFSAVHIMSLPFNFQHPQFLSQSFFLTGTSST